MLLFQTFGCLIISGFLICIIKKEGKTFTIDNTIKGGRWHVEISFQ